MNALFGFIVHSLLSSLSLLVLAFNPLLFPFFLFISTSDVTLYLGWPHMEQFTPGYGLRYGPYLHCPSTSRFPDLGTSIYWSSPHLGLSPISSLFLFWNLGQITSTFRLNVGTYPPCLRLSPPCVPLIADNMEIQDNLGYPWTFSPDNVDIRYIALHPLSSGSYWTVTIYLDLSCLGVRLS